MKFVRYGGLSAVKYDAKISNEFHIPPEKKGIFAFIHPYIETFLWAWKVKDKDYGKYIRQNKKSFNYKGMIWTHLEKEGAVKKGSWYLVHTKELEELLRKEKHLCLTSIRNDERMKKLVDNPKDPFVFGLGGRFSMDHLEVFIGHKEVCKIK